MVAVAQLVRALVCGTGGRGFKSPQPPHFQKFFKLNVINYKEIHLSIFCFAGKISG